MAQKRPFEDQEALEFSSKLPRQDLCDKLSFFSDISSFEDANQVSDISVDGGFTNGKLAYDEKFLSRGKDINHCGDDDPYSYLPGNHSFSSGITSSTSKEDVWIEAPFNNSCNVFVGVESSPDEGTSLGESSRTAFPLSSQENIYSVLLECPPHKQVRIGPLYQADIPPLKGIGGDLNPVNSPASSKDTTSDEDEGEEALAGASIIPMHGPASLEEVIKLGQGRTDCSCPDNGSIRCVQKHVVEARDKLKILLGLQVFEELGFSDIGELVADKWTKEEENLFHEGVFSNPSSIGRKFWNYLSHAFPSRTKAEIVSYYYNVFMLRKRAEQNRFDLMNVDSDNDEWQANEEEEDEDSVVESPMYQLHPLERSRDHSNECQDKNFVDGTCVDDEYTSPMIAHIRRMSDSQADGDFHPKENTLDERSYDGTQDDSCTSFDTRAVGPGSQAKYDNEACNSDLPGAVHASRLRSEDLMPAFSVIEEVFRDEISDCQHGGEKGPG